MNDFLVTLTSPLLSGPFEVEVTASCESAAISRVRGLAFHHFRSEHMLTAECSVEALN